MNTDQSLRKHLVELLDGAQAHATFDNVIENFPAKARGETPKGLRHSAWMLLEHIRISQQDILDFSRNPKYKPLKWPDNYWPKTASPPDVKAWDKSVKSFHEDLDAMKELVRDAKTDLFAQIPLATATDNPSRSYAPGRSQLASLGAIDRCAKVVGNLEVACFSGALRGFAD